MSTADSQLLVGASAIVRDLYEKIWKEGSRVEQSKLVKLSRVVVAVLVMLAVALAFVAEDLVFWLVLFAWAGLGAALGPTTILALYWKGTTRIGVIVGMITATLTTIIWYLIPSLKAITYELIPGFLVGLIVTWMVSLATKMPDNAEEMMHQMK
jgi:Na+/proline symporter